VAEYPGLQIIGTYEVEPHTSGGMNWGRHVVRMQFPKIKRKSKGWRRHVRKSKAASSNG
jgi:hypothetical protein